MSVERRYSKRYEMQCDVYIRYRRQRVFPAKAENCSLYGMYLRTENLTLLSGGLVELEIYFDNRNWQITGLVTHVRKNGLGVMFWKEQPDFYRAVESKTADIAVDQVGEERLFGMPVYRSLAEESAP